MLVAIVAAPKQILTDVGIYAFLYSAEMFPSPIPVCITPEIIPKMALDLYLSGLFGFLIFNMLKVVVVPLIRVNSVVGNRKSVPFSSLILIFPSPDPRFCALLQIENERKVIIEINKIFISDGFSGKC